MAKVRKFVAYRRLERPYTRKSRYREKSFIRGNPQTRIIRHNMGNPQGSFDYVLKLRVNDTLQIRDRALEACRLILNRHLEKKIGKELFYLRLKVYPHHHLRENPLASGAGADRLSTGMKNSFGKVIDIAAQVHAGKDLFELHIGKEKLLQAKTILALAKSKVPCGIHITVEPRA
ncbi:MAG: 50S ribosomal protein L16 [Candidatus Woesearchaeota archaeon]